MANIRGIVGQSTRLASRDGYGGHINFFHYWSDDTQAQCEVPGYLTRRQMPTNYVDGDVIYIFGTDFNQTYTGVTDAGTLEISLTAVHGAGSGTVLGDGNISNIQLVGNQLLFTGTAGAFNGPIDLSPIIPLNTVTAINSIDFRPAALPNQYTVSMTWTDKNGVINTTTDSTPVTLAPETITALADNGNGTYTYTNEAGVATLIDARGVVTTMVDNLNGTFTYTNEAGVPVTIAAGAETTTTLVDQNNGMLTYTNEAGIPATFNAFAEVTAVGQVLVGDMMGSVAPLGIGTAGQVLTVNVAGTTPEWRTPGVNAVNTTAQLPNPTTVQAGTLWVVNADPNLAFNGAYKVDGNIPGFGVGYTQI